MLLLGSHDLLEFLFGGGYFGFLFLLQLCQLEIQFLLLLFFEFGLLLFHFLFVLEFELGDQRFILH